MLSEIREFAENSSMKGVPRFVKAKSVPIKMLWLVSVCTLLTLSLAVCVQIIQQYLEKPKVVKLTNLDSFSDDFYKYHDLFSLPTVTVCNQNPLTVYNGYSGTSWKEYLAMALPVVADYDEVIRGRYLSPRGYLEYIGPQAVATNKSIGDFITDCEYGYLMDSRRYSCKGVLKVEEFPNAIYSQCYTISIDFKKLTYHLDGAPTFISLTLFVNEVSSPKLQAGTEARGTSGVAVVIHEPGELPVLDNALFASTGQLTSFQAKKSLYQRIHDSDDPCWEKLDERDELFGYCYSQMGCLMAGLQEVTMENCSCISSDLLMMNANHDLPQLHFCGAFNINVSQMEEEMLCSDTVMRNGIHDIVGKCIIPCRDIVHDVSVSSSVWPSPAIQLSFFEQYIQHKPFAEYFQDYATVYKNYTRTHDHNTAMAKLRELSGIRTNFAKIEITAPQIHATLYTATLQFSLADLIASIGGNLNLWSGISAIIIIEVLDLIMRMFRILAVHNPQQSYNMDNTPRC